MLMQSISWASFCVSNPLTKSIVHFFPSSGPVGAPYQASCSLTLLQAGSEPQTVVIEGARLGQPDGVRLDLAFPQAGESSICGLLVELSTPQPRIDLSASACIVELASRSSSVKFRPQLAGAGGRRAPLLALKDAGSASRLLSVNTSERLQRALVKRCRKEGEAAAEGHDEQSPLITVCSLEVPPYGVAELPLDGLGGEAAQAIECSWGRAEAALLYVESDSPAVTHYAVYRDIETQRFISVVAI